ncbi:hypothetical protein J4210_03865 [Candidatus Woesearchaeota archaeon]|nr:hypothetical protein [Candidatus Woesearchaeota archaeon]
MSWFSRKKVPKVPFPTGHPAGEGALRFPSMRPEERVIEPAKVKEAVGLEMPSITEEAPTFAARRPLEESVFPREEQRAALPEATSRSGAARIPSFHPKAEEEPLFVKVDVYQRILGEIESIKTDVSAAFEASKRLETSEYNEEENYTKLKRAIRVIHDRLLQVDKNLFKVQGS